MSKQPHTLNFTITTTFTVECESAVHAESVAQSLERWAHQEVYRTEPIARSTEVSYVTFPSSQSPPPIPESRVNP